MAINVKRNEAVKYHSHWVAYLHEVARTGSIRGAAKALNVAPSAVSRRLRDIEALVGVRMFERVPRGLRLTAGGIVVAEHVKQVLSGFGTMQNALDELRGLERGHVTVSGVHATAAEMLPRILSSISKRHPNITFTCNFIGSDEIVEQIVSGDTDVGISFNPAKQRQVRQVASVSMPFGAVMTPDHPLSKRRSLRLADLAAANARLIFPDFTQSTRSEIDDILDRNALEVHPVVTSFNRDFVVGMALFGGGVAIRTAAGSEREVREGKLVFVPLKEPGLKPRRLTLLVHATRRLSFAASLLVDVARQHFNELSRDPVR